MNNIVSLQPDLHYCVNKDDKNNNTIHITWQIPNSTELDAYNNIKNIDIAQHCENKVTYIAYPWATLIDIHIIHCNQIDFQDFLKSINIHCNFCASSINVTTVQHYKMETYLKYFAQMNIRIIFYPHCNYEFMRKCINKHNIILSPIYLTPIITNNYKFDRDIPAQRIRDCQYIPNKLRHILINDESIVNSETDYLCSFIGTTKYVSLDVVQHRNNIVDILRKFKNSYVHVTPQWHFSKHIYNDHLKSIIKHHYDDSDIKINELNYYYIMISSKFIICPYGIGLNSFRISEAIANRKVPVILTNKLVLPTIYNIHIKDCAIIINNDDIKHIFNILMNVTVSEYANKLHNVNKIANYVSDISLPIKDYFSKSINVIYILRDMHNFAYDMLSKMRNHQYVKNVYVLYEHTCDDYYEEHQQVDVIYKQIKSSTTLNDIMYYYHEQLNNELCIITEYGTMFDIEHVLSKAYVSDNKILYAYNGVLYAIICRSCVHTNKNLYLNINDIHTKISGVYQVNINLTRYIDIPNTQLIISETNLPRVIFYYSQYKTNYSMINSIKYIITDAITFKYPDNKLDLFAYMSNNNMFTVIIADTYSFSDVSSLDVPIMIVHHEYNLIDCLSTHMSKNNALNTFTTHLKNNKKSLIIAPNSYYIFEFTKICKTVYTHSNHELILPYICPNYANEYIEYEHDYLILYEIDETVCIDIRKINNVIRNASFVKYDIETKYVMRNANKHNILFLQLCIDGNTYTSLTAMREGYVILTYDTGLFFNDVSENAFVRVDSRKINSIDYIVSKIKYAIDNNMSLSINAITSYNKLHVNKNMFDIIIRKRICNLFYNVYLNTQYEYRQYSHHVGYDYNINIPQISDDANINEHNDILVRQCGKSISNNVSVKVNMTNSTKFATSYRAAHIKKPNKPVGKLVGCKINNGSNVYIPKN
jgi:hypothetical protein